MKVKTKLNIVNVTNWIMLVTFVLIMLWMYVFVVNMTFNFTVLAEKTSTLFHTSIVAAIAMILGAAIINISTNISIIADSKAVQEEAAPVKSRKAVFLWTVAVIIAVPVFLFFSDKMSKIIHERKIVKEVEDVMARYNKTVLFVTENAEKKEKFKEVSEGVTFLASQNKELDSVSLIVMKIFQGQNSYVYINEWKNRRDNAPEYLKCDEKTRKYLDSVFLKNNTTKYYDKENSRLYCPVASAGRISVLYFQKYMRYGKIGS
ncbi:MAG: hypothetical protein NTX32_06665 [Candidatus Firestonebacteria bacterium]|nr:hypothetical protein [Candidatus Firestonebacteria bacterium]